VLRPEALVSDAVVLSRTKMGDFSVRSSYMYMQRRASEHHLDH